MHKTLLGWVDAEALLLTDAAPAAPIYLGGWVFDDTGALFVVASGTAIGFRGGIGYDIDGAMLVVDASGGVPAGAVYLGGLPVSASGELCVDADNAAASYVNGLPISAAGGVAASGINFSGSPANAELREDGGYELREDGGYELRE